MLHLFIGTFSVMSATVKLSESVISVSTARITTCATSAFQRLPCANSIRLITSSSLSRGLVRLSFTLSSAVMESANLLVLSGRGRRELKPQDFTVVTWSRWYTTPCATCATPESVATVS